MEVWVNEGIVGRFGRSGLLYIYQFEKVYHLVNVLSSCQVKSILYIHDAHVHI